MRVVKVSHYRRIGNCIDKLVYCCLVFTCPVDRVTDDTCLLVFDNFDFPLILSDNKWPFLPSSYKFSERLGNP